MLIHGVLFPYSLSIKSVFIFLFSLILFNLSCAPTHDPVETTQTVDKQAEQKIKTLLMSPDQITFNDVNELVLKDNCVKCHNPNKKYSGIDLTTHEALLGQESKATIFPLEPLESLLYQSISHPESPRRMPPLGEPPLTESQKTLVFQWIKAGAKKEISSNEPTPLTLEQQLQPYFDQPQLIDYPIVEKYVFNDGSCLQCHSDKGATPSHDAMLFGADLNSYESLSYLNAIVKGVPFDEPIKNADGTYTMNWGSGIYKSVAITQSMPPAKKGFQPLSALRVKLLRLWILNCAIKDLNSITDDQLLPTPNPKGQIRNCD